MENEEEKKMNALEEYLKKIDYSEYEHNDPS